MVPLISVWRLVELAVVLAAAAGAGSLLLHMVHWGHQAPSRGGVRQILAITLGLGLVSYSVLVIGLLGGLYTGVIWGWLLLLALASVVNRRSSFWHEMATVIKNGCRAIARLTWPYRIVLLVVAALALLSLVGALSPPLGPDDLSYHFVGPQRYLQAHSIIFILDKYYTNLPFTVEMLWTAAMAIDAGELAQVINWSIGLLVLGWIVLLTRQAGLDRRHGLLAALLFYSITTVGNQSRTGSTELGGTLFFLAAIYLLLRWLEAVQPDWRTVLLAGVLAGFYAGTKLPNPIAVGLVGLWLVWTLWYQKHSSIYRSLSVGMLFGGVAAAVVGVWYVKAWVMTGNPVYPFLHSTFGGPPMRVELLGEAASTVGKSWTEELTKESPFWRLLVQPYRLVADPSSLRGHIGPIWLAFLPMGLALSVNSSSSATDQMRRLIQLGLLYYLFWVPIYRFVRIGLPALALFAPVVVSGVIWFVVQGRLLRLLAVSVLAGWLGTSLLATWQDVQPALRVVAGAQSVDNYLITRGPEQFNFTAYDAVHYMNQSLPRDSKVLFWETRGYYLQRPYLYASEFIATMADPERIYDPEQVIGELRRFGITHVAMSDYYPNRRLRETLEVTGELDCLYKGRTMTVCALPGAS